jgi:branched-subunit amino acid aminotransferase/4-amino-4-deoxychorismate lyase
MSTFYQDGKWISNGAKLLDDLVPWQLDGRGVFETMRAYQGRIFLLKEHLRRLELGLKSLKILFLMNVDQLESTLYMALSRNRLKNGRLRLTVWQPQDVTRVTIIAQAIRPYSSQQYRKGFRAVLMDTLKEWTRKSPHTKSIDYNLFHQAYTQAKQDGYDEAILVNARGELMEGSRSNLFIVDKGRLWTPSFISGCLAGVTRQALLQLASGMGIKAGAAVLSPERLYGAQEAFLTGSWMEVMSLTEVGEHVIGNGKVGPVTQQLQTAYQQLVKAHCQTAR